MGRSRAVVLGSLLLAAAARPASPAPSPRTAVMHGVLRGTLVTPEGYWEWKPDVESFYDRLGTFSGTTREFEHLEVEFGGDRRVWSSAQRATYEAQHVRFDVERGKEVRVESKGDVAVAHVRGFAGETVYVCGSKAFGRTILFARTSGELKYQAALERVVQVILGTVKPPEDDVDSWLPAEVRTRWNRTPGDLLVVDDGQYPDAAREAALKAVRDAHAFVKRMLGVSSFATTLPPVVRLTGANDLAVHVASKGAPVDQEANYVPWAGELLIAAHGTHPDGAAIARAAARQAVHLCLGSAEAEPVATGLALLAEAAAIGAPAGSLLPRDEGAAYERVREKRVKTWATLMKLGRFMGWGDDDREARGLEAELAVGYLVGSGSPMAKASLAGWVAAMKKSGHPDAGAEGAFAPMDPAKSDAEFWAYWTDRAEGPKKPGPKGAPAKPAEPAPTKPAGKPAK
jgi:hypothetical protein